ncbi:MAG: A/G-specific adenine glycosylase, partial [Sandaracinaceae bacterium]|nr:A/G-specific adenine glycosylase [Sandaracinaceae bacterium]
MLQQTRVETVLRYYAPFLARFPTPDVLAAASEDDVLARWSGLGYYRRARLLHEGAKAVVARHGGRVPEDADARRALPGVGRYTAGAIGSIAFGRREPIVDGNVARVLSRLDAIEAPLGSGESEAALWAEASAWAEHDAPGVVNQALMELGATLCTPSAPRCGD